MPFSTASTLVTSPTFTPAIRTGERSATRLALANTASSSYGLANGLALVKAKNVPSPTTSTAIRPAANGFIPVRCALPRGMSENLTARP